MGIVAGAGLALWATGELAGWLTSGRWPPVPPDRAGVLLVGVILHPLHPALAWPRSAPLQPAGSGPSAAALSETTLLYGLGATVVAGVAALVLLVRGAGRSVLSG
ncbi:MAG: hypothetical protein J2O39_06810, partial [Acidimicrobiales bacterium]|nr:hypothetical protein [Acidimicrobiales bacterium]